MSEPMRPLTRWERRWHFATTPMLWRLRLTVTADRYRRTRAWAFVQRVLLRIAFGPSLVRYMEKSVRFDPRTGSARWVDIIVRKDGHEIRVEADWVKHIYCAFNRGSARDHRAP